MEDKIHNARAKTVCGPTSSTEGFREFEELKTKENLKHAANHGSCGYSVKESLKWKE